MLRKTGVDIPARPASQQSKFGAAKQGRFFAPTPAKKA